MIKVQASLIARDVTLRNATMGEIAKWFDGQHVKFERAALMVHRKTVFEILIYLIRLTPVVTGRLRGSWTPFLDKYGKQSFYARYLNDRSLAGGRPKTIGGQVMATLGGVLGMSAVAQGKRLGFFMDNALLTTVGSNVVYGAKVDESSHYMTKTAAQAQLLINQNFENFVEASTKSGWIPDLKDDPTGGGNGQ